MDQMERLVNTATAARALSVHPATLRRWAEDGTVTPTAKTAGGHARWDLERLRAEVQTAAERHEQGLPATPTRDAVAGQLASAAQVVRDATPARYHWALPAPYRT